MLTDAVHRYLQVFFNTSLCMVFLWLLLQFILTVQRDVQQRILEHSMGTAVPSDAHTGYTDLRQTSFRRLKLVRCCTRTTSVKGILYPTCSNLVGSGKHA